MSQHVEMAITDADVEAFRKRSEERGVFLSCGEAKARLLELLRLYWILSHRPPRAGSENPCEPPPPPWL